MQCQIKICAQSVFLVKKSKINNSELKESNCIIIFFIYKKICNRGKIRKKSE